LIELIRIKAKGERLKDKGWKAGRQRSAGDQKNLGQSG
jgi:hypothetical protein